MPEKLEPQGVPAKIETSNATTTPEDTVLPSVQGKSTQPPATEIADLVKAEVEKVRTNLLREAQAQRDKMESRLHQTYQHREHSIVERLKQQMAAAGVEGADELEKRVYDEAEVAEYRAWKQQAAAQNESVAYGQDIVRKAARFAGVQLAPDDPELWKPFENWEEFEARVEKRVKDEARQAREAERAAEDERKRTAANEQIASPELATLGGTPAGSPMGKSDLSRYNKLSDSDALYKLARASLPDGRRGKRK